jgi:hypothetical protein
LGGEALQRADRPSYEGRIVGRGAQSSDAMREKARFVLGAMEQRMAALGFGWADVTATAPSPTSLSAGKPSRVV